MRLRTWGMLALVIVAGMRNEASATPAPTYADPFAYCAAVQTIDAPDARYTGPKFPPTVARGLQKALDISATEPIESLQGNSVWRCMDGKVYACTVGANLPCEAKANTSQTPNAGMTEFCQSNPGSDFIPMVASGRETVYEWRCDGKIPMIVRQMAKVDQQGFVADIWYKIE